MGHQSENAVKLAILNVGCSLDQIFDDKSVWFLKLPYFKNQDELPLTTNVVKELNDFIDKIKNDATIAILTSPYFAAKLLSDLTYTAHFKLWIGIKLKSPIILEDSTLHKHHAALIIITKYSHALQHTKTRIGYTFCPTCQKTTKDYGGKKHLYHEFGTMMSDVWRDTDIDFEKDNSVIIDRLSDLFGIELYKNLKFIDLSKQYQPNIVHKLQSKDTDSINVFIYEGSTKSAIVNGDCLEKLKKIPSNSIDFCFADPPYNVNKKYESWNDDIDIIEYFNWCDQWLAELARIIKPGKTVAILNIPQWSIRHFKCLNSLLTFQDFIIWEALSVPVRQIMPANYPIICFSKGKTHQLPGLIREKNSELEAKSLKTQKELFCTRLSCINQRKKEHVSDQAAITDLWWDIHRLKHNTRRVDHPTQLPPQLMYRLISLFTNENDVVLDPFNGSGTTSLCAAQLNRKYFGIELSEKYYSISMIRHNELSNGLDPFRKQDKTPIAKNSHVQRLKKQKYEVSKKILQLEVKEIATKLNHVPTREDILVHSKYPITYFDNYFINWGEVTAAVRTTGMKDVENKLDYYAKYPNGISS